MRLKPTKMGKLKWEECVFNCVKPNDFPIKKSTIDFNQIFIGTNGDQVIIKNSGHPEKPLFITAKDGVIDLEEIFKNKKFIEWAQSFQDQKDAKLIEPLNNK